jgi:hypothetical protein
MVLLFMVGWVQDTDVERETRVVAFGADDCGATDPFGKKLLPGEAPYPFDGSATLPYRAES